jgi:hypothetical protein
LLDRLQNGTKSEEEACGRMGLGTAGKEETPKDEENFDRKFWKQKIMSLSKIVY